jgi:hypothetical protein
MKKFLLLAICLLITSFVSAQQYIFGQRSDYVFGSSTESRMGIEVGTNISNVMTSSSTISFNTASVTGFNAGLIFEIPVSSAASLAPEVLFSQKGYMATTPNGGFTQKNSFIDVPLLIKFKLSSIAGLSVGPQFSYLLSTQNTYNPGFMALNEHYYENNNISTYWDWAIGLSFNIIRHLDLRARYTIGLTQTPSNGDIYVPNYRSQVWQFGLGYKF